MKRVRNHLGSQNCKNLSNLVLFKVANSLDHVIPDTGVKLL